MRLLVARRWRSDLENDAFLVRGGETRTNIFRSAPCHSHTAASARYLDAFPAISRSDDVASIPYLARQWLVLAHAPYNICCSLAAFFGLCLVSILLRGF